MTLPEGATDASMVAYRGRIEIICWQQVREILIHLDTPKIKKPRHRAHVFADCCEAGRPSRSTILQAWSVRRILMGRSPDIGFLRFQPRCSTVSATRMNVKLEVRRRRGPVVANYQIFFGNRSGLISGVLVLRVILGPADRFKSLCQRLFKWSIKAAAQVS